jgi:hypothetical protein
MSNIMLAAGIVINVVETRSTDFLFFKVANIKLGAGIWDLNTVERVKPDFKDGVNFFKRTILDKSCSVNFLGIQLWS